MTTPADLQDVSLRELLDAWHRHVGRLVDERHQIGDRLPVGRLRLHALDALATGQALAEQLLNTRWTTCREALAFGAPVEHVAAAMGLDPDEVAAGLQSWASGQHREHLMTAVERDEVFALVDASEHLPNGGER